MQETWGGGGCSKGAYFLELIYGDWNVVSWLSDGHLHAWVDFGLAQL